MNVIDIIATSENTTKAGFKEAAFVVFFSKKVLSTFP